MKKQIIMLVIVAGILMVQGCGHVWYKPNTPLETCVEDWKIALKQPNHADTFWSLRDLHMENEGYEILFTNDILPGIRISQPIEGIRCAGE